VSGRGGPRSPCCDVGLPWAGALCPACELPPQRRGGEQLTLHAERLGGLATVDGRRGMYVRAGAAETRWAARLAAAGGPDGEGRV
jgi:hypothetical protein